jgi:hypothetical protein
MLTIKEFFAIEDLINTKWGRKAYKYVDYCGLLPVRPLEYGDYFCTPVNSLCFARTGGDGVHFSILNYTSESDTGPVVMTVPMVSRNNIVVAENLEEFFAIGCRNGWFALEQLAYNESEVLEYYATLDEELSEEEQTFLTLLRSELGVEHAPLTAERLAELDRRFFSQLQIKSMDEYFDQ